MIIYIKSFIILVCILLVAGYLVTHPYILSALVAGSILFVFFMLIVSHFQNNPKS